jgi:hypothetical protein
MPRIIDYPQVLATMQSRGFVSLYHNAGAFGFASDADVQTIGFIAAPDPTIRPQAQRFVKVTPDPAAELMTMARALEGDAWLMPKSHWHYELHFGNRELLESLLPTIGIEPAALRERNDGSAISFSREEHSSLTGAIRRLLDGLQGSDFLLAFPDAQTLATIHHHRQIWLQSHPPRLTSLQPD